MVTIVSCLPLFVYLFFLTLLLLRLFVCLQMSSQVLLQLEPLATVGVGAWERLLVRVSVLVTGQGALLHEPLTAGKAFEMLLSGVGHFVSSQ